MHSLRFLTRAGPLLTKPNSRQILRSPAAPQAARGLSSSTNADSGNSMTDTTKALGDGLLAGQRHCLARSITLAESARRDHKEQAALLMDYVMEHKGSGTITVPTPTVTSKPLFTSGKTLRLGIAGPPGAGKSTFIEALGMRLIERNHRVAVIPVDPSSHISGGSILGDKTRMEQLSICPQAYVRASPTRGVLGGIAEHTADVVSLCECAGYDVVIVESVGLGQSEVDIDHAVDLLMMIVPPGGGDGLQASKKGIMEATDIIAVNKADGTLASQAKHTRGDYQGSLAFVRQKNIDWKPQCLLMSARTGKGLTEVEAKLAEYHTLMSENGGLEAKRLKQSVHWMWGQYRRELVSQGELQPAVQSLAELLMVNMSRGVITPRAAAGKLLEVTSYTE